MWFATISVRHNYSFLLLTVHSVTVIALNPEVVAQLLIVDCSSDVPSTRNQTIGQSLILRCNVNIVRPIMNTELVNFKWSSNNKTLMMTDQIGQTQDHYVISQLNTSNDGQEYECEVMIRSTPPETESGAIVLDISGKISNFMHYSCSSKIKFIKEKG